MPQAERRNVGLDGTQADLDRVWIGAGLELGLDILQGHPRQCDPLGCDHGIRPRGGSPDEAAQNAQA
ncbi:hypothetical protein GCM10011408_20650 [Dyella caseinilytica]|nr:hypothetical protein GCM10011408_20650 [Dyella caseinilytica]